MSSALLNSTDIKAQALRLGFVACGLAKAEPVAEPVAERYRHWLESGFCAEMDYMRRNVDMRLQPHLLVPGVRTIVSLAMNFMPERHQPAISLYAQGKDYHDVMKQRMQELMQTCGLEGRCFVVAGTGNLTCVDAVVNLEESISRLSCTDNAGSHAADAGHVGLVHTVENAALAVGCCLKGADEACSTITCCDGATLVDDDVLDDGITTNTTEETLIFKIVVDNHVLDAMVLTIEFTIELEISIFTNR